MQLPEITDDHMRGQLAMAKQYSMVLLYEGPRTNDPDSRAIVWEHGRRNMALREAGILAVVCPVADDSTLCGMGVFVTDVDETRRILDDDPGVQAGVFTYVVHPVRGFPGAALP